MPILPHGAEAYELDGAWTSSIPRCAKAHPPAEGRKKAWYHGNPPRHQTPHDRQKGVGVPHLRAAERRPKVLAMPSSLPCLRQATLPPGVGGRTKHHRSHHLQCVQYIEHSARSSFASDEKNPPHRRVFYMQYSDYSSKNSRSFFLARERWSLIAFSVFPTSSAISLTDTPRSYFMLTTVRSISDSWVVA